LITVGSESDHVVEVPGTEALSDVSCAGTYWCVAVGSTTSGDGAVVPLGWETAMPVRAFAGTTNFVGVSCPEPEFCIGVGSSASASIVSTFPIWG
jgi:hypothetical protein